MKRKSLKKLIVPLAALFALLLQDTLGIDVGSAQIETVLEVVLAIAAGAGIVANPDK